MHIGFLTPEYIQAGRVDGGLANYLHKVGRALTARGHRISIFVLAEHNAAWRDEQMAVYEVRWPPAFAGARRLRRLRRFLPLLRQVGAARALAAVVWRVHRHSRLDLLQTSSYATPGLLLRRNGYIPLVCRISSYTPLLRSAYGRRRNLGDYMSDWLEIRQVLDADAAFAPSHLLANTFARLEGYRPLVIPTPVAPPALHALDESLYQSRLAGTPYLLFFGTLSRIKGVDLLADVIAPVLEQHSRLMFVFIGRDDGLPDGQQVFDYLCARCPTCVHRMLYLPAMPKSRLYPFIAHATAVLMPSRVDNYPNACLEAQSLGIPVIGTHDSSLDEMIVDNETGFLVPNEDTAGLRVAIERLLARSPAEQQAMRDRILAHIQAIHAEDRVGQLVDLYATTCATFQRKG